MCLLHSDTSFPGHGIPPAAILRDRPRKALSGLRPPRPPRLELQGWPYLLLRAVSFDSRLPSISLLAPFRADPLHRQSCRGSSSYLSADRLLAAHTHCVQYPLQDGPDMSINRLPRRNSSPTAYIPSFTPILQMYGFPGITLRMTFYVPTSLVPLGPPQSCCSPQLQQEGRF